MDADALAEVVGSPVTSLVRLSGGASRQTWRFESGGRRLIVQCDRDTGMTTRPGMQVEARLLDLARTAGVPVAGVVASGGSDGLVGPGRSPGLDDLGELDLLCRVQQGDHPDLVEVEADRIAHLCHLPDGSESGAGWFSGTDG